MALAAAYKQFLAAPNSSQLAADATLHYITTTTSFRGPTDIIKHVSTLRNQVKKKKEDFLWAIEGQNAIAAEVDTTLEFTVNGGPYLPALDDNFLTDRTVHQPLMHIVTFDHDGKILQIRQSWDQGALLKQLDVMGRTGRNWPIRDSKDQLKMIENCVKSAHSNGAPAPSIADVSTRGRGDSAIAMEEEPIQNRGSVISPKGGVKPRQRGFSEILGDESEDVPGSPSAGRGRSESPSKAIAPKAGGAKKFQHSNLFSDDEEDEGVNRTPAPKAGGAKKFQPSRLFSEDGEEENTNGIAAGTHESPSKMIAPKAGGSKKFAPNRLFDADEDEQAAEPQNGQQDNRFYRPNPNKYNHFEFADGSDPQDAPRPADPTPQKTAHSSNWSFNDFATPQKEQSAKPVRPNEVRHWGDEEDPADAPQRPAVAKPRRDAESHWEFVDDGTPRPQPHPVRPRGATQNSGMGLYQNNVYDEDEVEAAAAGEARPLGAVTNLKDRGRDFESHWAMSDSPVKETAPKGPVGSDRMKAVKMMDANWSSYDESPKQKENRPVASKNDSRGPEGRGIAIAGDGMGGSKGSNRNWFFGEDDEESQPAKSVPGRKPAAKSGGFNWDF
ncbi:hypothetical protein F4780DRAFT_609830 [Xylariomycetidae sp. FL0641]|nr:hypothetical protein F4780DRAFT_609830 [Xylariomycetidae sp. FL0641]